MLARIEDAFHLTVRHHAENIRQLIKAVSFLLSQTALVAFVFAVWRLSADLNWTGDFIVTSGLLSHWQVWLAIAVACMSGVVQLNRLGRESKQETVR